MTRSSIAGLAIAYVLLVGAASAGFAWTMALDPSRPATGLAIVSHWRRGHRVARAVTRDDPTAVLAEPRRPGVVRVVESVTDEAPLPQLSPAIMAAFLAPGRDGIAVTYEGRDCWLTPEDLLNAQLYLRRFNLGGLGVELGVDTYRALDRLGEECGASPSELLAQGRFRRFVVHREVFHGKTSSPASVETHVTAGSLRRSVLAAAYYLARHLERDGRFDYELDAITYRRSKGYSLPRHAGATLFLAEAAELSVDSALSDAALRAARYLSRERLDRCGPRRCIRTRGKVDLGASAMSLLAFTAVLKVAADRDLSAASLELTAFLRSQQRPDGEFMHLYDLEHQRPVDVQLPYYSGEAILALARVHRVTRDAKDLAAASRGLRYLTRAARAEVSGHYVFDTHHWTCQAVEDLWDRAPDRDALRLCLDWQESMRGMQADASTTLGDLGGGYVESIWFPVPPRLGVMGSRSEGGLATLEAATAAGISSSELDALEEQNRRALGYMLRHQLLPGATHLMRYPELMEGAFPASPVDYKVRIDVPQHVGSAMIRYVKLLESRGLGARSWGVPPERSVTRAEIGVVEAPTP